MVVVAVVAVVVVVAQMAGAWQRHTRGRGGWDRGEVCTRNHDCIDVPARWCVRYAIPASFFGAWHMSIARLWAI